jgi:hypothetical protein
MPQVWDVVLTVIAGVVVGLAVPFPIVWLLRARARKRYPRTRRY